MSVFGSFFRAAAETMGFFMEGFLGGRRESPSMYSGYSVGPHLTYGTAPIASQPLTITQYQAAVASGIYTPTVSPTAPTVPQGGFSGPYGQVPESQSAPTPTTTVFAQPITVGGGQVFGGVRTISSDVFKLPKGPAHAPIPPDAGPEQPVDPGSEKRKQRGDAYRI
jgi:hypothetical protein